MSHPENISTAEFAKRIRKHVITMTARANSSHVGSCLSIADILAMVYGEVLRFDPDRPDWADRDRLLLSKGHGCAALYAALAETGYFPKDWLDSYYLNGTHLAGHATHKGTPGVELSTGSLGHALPVACGMTLAGKRDGK